MYTGDSCKVCIHVPYPNHPHLSRTVGCGASLLKKVKRGRKTKLVPIKIYSYQ